MRWKAHFFLRPNQTQTSKNFYGFNSMKNPPSIDGLKEFEDGMLNLIQSVKFQPVESTFLKDLNDVREVKRINKLLIPLDKTTNFYKMEPTTYNGLLAKNITKSYNKASPLTTETVRQESQENNSRVGHRRQSRRHRQQRSIYHP